MKDYSKFSDDDVISFTQSVISPMVAKTTDRSSVYAKIGKRSLDIFIAISAALFLFPLIVLCLAVTALDGKSPIFGHRRVGLNGQEFKCWKIRSMVANAEMRLQTYLEQNPAAQQEWAATRKLSNDPRITRFGQFLRKSSIDELPQLWNVLIGQMSIVGPRPVVRDELEQMYPRGLGRSSYLQMRPGITGLWQVSGRNQASYNDRVAYDIAYRQEYSLKTDLRIIAKTFGAVVNRTGM